MYNVFLYLLSGSLTLTTQTDFYGPGGKNPLLNIVGKGENAGQPAFFSFLYAHQRQDVLWDHPWWADGRAASPILCSEHISKTIKATVMKLHGWIDLMKAECSAQES